MRKIAWMLIATITLSLIGCAGGKEETGNNGNVVESGNQQESTSEKESVVETESETESVIEYSTYDFEPMEEILNASWADYKVQVCDVTVRLGMKMSEFMQVIEGSSVEYIVEYVPTAMLQKANYGNCISKVVDFYVETQYGEEKAFSVCVVNFTTEDIINLEDGIVLNVTVEDSTNSVADSIYYAKGYVAAGGFAYADFKNDMEKDVLKVSLWNEAEDGFIRGWADYYLEQVQMKVYLYDYMMNYQPTVTYYFQVDENTGICTGLYAQIDMAGEYDLYERGRVR